MGWRSKKGKHTNESPGSVSTRGFPQEDMSCLSGIPGACVITALLLSPLLSPSPWLLSQSLLLETQADPERREWLLSLVFHALSLAEPTLKPSGKGVWEI